MAPNLMEVKVHLPQDPVKYAWDGGTKLATDESLPGLVTYSIIFFTSREAAGHRLV